MTQEEVLKIFKDYSALLEGHFKLSSGLHSGQYLQCALLLQYPNIATKLCAELAKKFKDEKITAVIGPALGGITVSYEVARSLGARALFTERDPERGDSSKRSIGANAMVLRRGFSIDKSDTVLLVEDVITTGGSVSELVNIVKASGARLVGIAALIDRSDGHHVGAGKADFGVPFKTLAKVDIVAYNETDCPFCKQGIPIVKPGSRK